jgi:hypothetical protein
MTPDYEAIKAGAKEAVTEWLDTAVGRQTIADGARSAVLDWIELTGQGSCAIDSGAERAVAAWLKDHKPAIVRAVAGAVR